MRYARWFGGMSPSENSENRSLTRRRQMERNTPNTAVRRIVPILGLEGARQRKNGKPEERKPGNPDAKREPQTVIEQIKDLFRALSEKFEELKFEELREIAFELEATRRQLVCEQGRTEKQAEKVRELQAALEREREETARLRGEVLRMSTMVLEATDAFEEERRRMAQGSASPPGNDGDFSGELTDGEFDSAFEALMSEPPPVPAFANAAPSADPDVLLFVDEQDIVVESDGSGEEDSESPFDAPEFQGDACERPRDTQVYDSGAFASSIPAALDPVSEEPAAEPRRTTAGYEELRVPAMSAQPEDRASSSEEPPPVPPLGESRDEPRSEDGGRKTLIFSPAPASTEVPVGENPGPVPSVRSDGSPLPTKRQQVRVTNKPKNGSNGS
jgi:hypothetical protein